MQVKKLFWGSMAVTILSLIVFALGRLFGPLPDAAVRVNGVVMMLCIVSLSYSTVRLRRERDGR